MACCASAEQLIAACVRLRAMKPLPPSAVHVVSITRADFDELTGPLLEKAIVEVQKEHPHA